jgi:hypothetical protein
VAGVRTVQLGQFVDENADAIVEALEVEGIVHWTKRHGGLARTLFAGDWGTRIFVDADRLEQAQDITRGILGE